MKYLVDPTRTDDLVAIDQRFLNPSHASRKPGQGKKASVEESDLKRIVMSSEMSRQSMPYTDTLLLLVAVLSRLDYSGYGAVDPCVASTSSCRPGQTNHSTMRQRKCTYRAILISG